MTAQMRGGGFATGNKSDGAPHKHTPEEAARIVADYFASCEGIPLTADNGEPVFTKNGAKVWLKEPTPYTIRGLALSLYASLESFCNSTARLATKVKDGTATEEERRLCEIYTGARERVKEYAERRLYDREGATGAKFWLAAKDGWRDSVDINAQIQQKIVVSIDDSDDGSDE